MAKIEERLVYGVAVAVTVLDPEPVEEEREGGWWSSGTQPEDGPEQNNWRRPAITWCPPQPYFRA